MNLYFLKKAPLSFKDLHKGLETLQQFLCRQVIPERGYPEVHATACTEISRLLIDLGIFCCSLEQAMDLKLSKSFFPHGVGHALGLQVHDVAGEHDDQSLALKAPKDCPRLRTLRKIQPNDVLNLTREFLPH